MKYFIPVAVALVLGLNSCTKEEAPLPSIPSSIKVNGVSFNGTVHSILGIRDSTGIGGNGFVQIVNLQGLMAGNQLVINVDYTRYDDISGTYMGHGGDNMGNLKTVGYQEAIFNVGGIPTQKAWALAEDEVSTVSFSHLGNNRYMVGFDVYMEDLFDSLPDVHVTGLYTADFTAEFN